MFELGLLTLLVLAFGISLFLLRKRPGTGVERE
jgi:hypothetical protein